MSAIQDVRDQWKGARDQPNPSVIAAAARDLNRPIVGLFDSSLVVADPARHAHIARTVMTPDTGYPLDGLVHLLRTAHEIRSRNDRQTLGLSDLHAYCAEALGARVLQPARAAGDWSLAVPRRCKCRLCGTLGEFLRDSTRQQVDWPLAKDSRSHIHRIIDSHDLPVSHVTRRVGRPFTLVLMKTDALLKREAVERAGWERDLKWLTNVANAFRLSDGR